MGKAGFFFLLGIVQALIVSIGDLVILKAAVESPVLFVTIAVFCSLVFNSIIYTCVSLLGNPGKAIAIIFLVLQIAGGGGTFPIQTTPKFFQAISPYLPFTYAIDALRETVGVLFRNINYKSDYLSIIWIRIYHSWCYFKTNHRSIDEKSFI